MAHWARGKLGVSIIRTGLLFARLSPPWYHFFGSFWYYAFGQSVALLRGHSRTELEALLRPALLPRERTTDIKQRGWDASNNLLQYWLRRQYLEKTYGHTESFQHAEELFRDPKRLVSVEELEQIFHLSDWVYRSPKEKSLARGPLEEIREKLKGEGGSTNNTSQLTYEEILELAGASVMGRNEFNYYCEKHQIFEFFTKDYVQRLGQYLVTRSLQIAKEKKSNQITILEVGAGSGALAHFLQHESPLKAYSAEHSPACQIDLVATDSGQSGLQVHPEFEVVKAKFSSAIGSTNPDIILCSWMPMDDDWTAFFRQFSSVKEYILIGEYDDGCCGHNWFTWGHLPSRPPPSLRHFPAHFQRLVTSSTPPYEVDHYSRTLLPELSRLQFSRYDSQHHRGNSATFAFRKE